MSRPHTRSWQALARVMITCILLSTLTLESASAQSKTRLDHAAYAVKLHVRALGVGIEVQKFAQQLIFRLEKKREVDLDRAAAAFVSARRQVVLLKLLALLLERRIPAGHPAKAEIQTQRSRFRLFLKSYAEIRKKLEILTSGELHQAIVTFAKEHPPEAPASFSHFFQAGTVDESM